MTVKTDFITRAVRLLIMVLVLLTGTAAYSVNLSLAWNASADPNVAGYEVFYGLESGDYALSVDVGSSTNLVLTGLTAGVTYYLAVVSYDADDDQSPFSIEIVAALTPPQISDGPFPISAVSGGITSFNVVASSPTPITYQWFHNGTAVSAPKTCSYVTLQNISRTNAGKYNVVVSNTAGATTSSVVALTVLLPPLTLAPAWQPARGMQVSFTGSPNTAYVLWTTTNLLPPINWQRMVTNLADANGNWTFTDASALNTPACFYEASLE